MFPSMLLEELVYILYRNTLSLKFSRVYIEVQHFLKSVSVEVTDVFISGYRYPFR